MRNLGFKIALIVVVTAVSIWQLYPIEKKIRRGLDLQGGIHVVIEVARPQNSDKSLSDVTDRALEIIRNRVDGLGVSEPTIQKEGVNHIIVDLPGIKDPGRAIELIGKTALLEFRIVKDDATVSESGLADYELMYTRKKDERGIQRESAPFMVKKTAEMTGASLVDAYVGYDASGLPEVNISLNKEGAEVFSRVTAEHIGKRLAIVLDGVVKSAPTINTRIPDGRAQITGQFTMEEAKELALVLRAGALPAKVDIIHQEVVGPTLGREYVQKVLRASMYGAAFVVAFMTVYYLAFGMLANFAMALNILILLAVISAIRGVMTLPGIAGVALTCGMAVDANILIFERIREELRGGKSPKAAIEAGYHRAWSAIIDSNITTAVCGVILFLLGEGGVKGFGLTLTIGIAANLFTAVFVTKTITDFIMASRKIEHLRI